MTFGSEPTPNGMLHADLLLRRTGVADVVVGSADSTPFVPTDAGSGGPHIDAMIAGAALAVLPGDLLVLHVTMVAGTSDYIEFATQITLP